MGKKPAPKSKGKGRRAPDTDERAAASEAPEAGARAAETEGGTAA